MDRRSLILAGVFALAGCATTRGRDAARPFDPGDIVFQALEPLLGAQGGPDGLTIRLASRGCTLKADIAVHVERRDGAAYVAFARRKLDSCGQAVAEADIAFSWQELGLPPRVPLFLLNPINEL